MGDAISRDVEVLYMTDAIDEYVAGHVTDYAGKKLVNLAKEGANFGDDEKVAKVQITKRKTKEPLILSSPQHGVSANMARIQKGQTLQEKSLDGGDAKRVLEINHLHPLVDEMYKRIQVDEKDKTAEE